MRVLVETEAVPTICRSPDGTRLPGSSRFQLLAFDPTEELPTVGPPRPVLSFLAEVTPGETALRMGAPPAFEGAAAISVPRALLESLADTDLLAFRWTFVPEEWTRLDSNQRPLGCEPSALTAEPRVRQRGPQSMTRAA